MKNNLANLKWMLTHPWKPLSASSAWCSCLRNSCGSWRDGLRFPCMEFGKMHFWNTPHGKPWCCITHQHPEKQLACSNLLAIHRVYIAMQITCHINHWSQKPKLFDAVCTGNEFVDSHSRDCIHTCNGHSSSPLHSSQRSARIFRASAAAYGSPTSCVAYTYEGLWCTFQKNEPILLMSTSTWQKVCDDSCIHYLKISQKTFILSIPSMYRSHPCLLPVPIIGTVQI